MKQAQGCGQHTLPYQKRSCILRSLANTELDKGELGDDMNM